MTTKPTIDDVAPLPSYSSEATAHNLGRALAARALLNAYDACHLPVGHPDLRDALHQSLYLYGIVRLLRAADGKDPATADELALELHDVWGDGDVGDVLADWLHEYGVDPEQVIQIAAASIGGPQ